MRLLTLGACVMLASHGCDSEANGGTQLLLQVDADDAVVLALARVDVELYPADAQDGAAPARKQTFELTRQRPTDGAVRMPFSFAVTPGEHDEILIVVHGFSGQRDDAAVPDIEHKLLARFHTGEATRITAYLAQACFRTRALCDALDQTCGAAATPEGHRCEPLREAEPDEPGAFFPVASSTSERANTDSATREQPTGVCADVSDCPPDYPCVENDDGGYACRGLLPEAPITDFDPGSKSLPDFDVQAERGVVIDRVTGLIWQRELPTRYPGCTGTDRTDADTCRWQEATRYCEGLDLDGGGWRLPTKSELLSILGDTSKAPATDLDVFPDRPLRNSFWSASKFVLDPESSWAVQLGTGFVGAIPQYANYYARCVRGAAKSHGTPADRYEVDLKRETVADTHTHLTWQRQFEKNVESAAAARAYCEQLGEGWRLPTLKELQSLMTPLKAYPAFEYDFPNTPLGGAFWSSSPSTLSEGAFLLAGPSMGEASSDVSLRSLQQPEPLFEITFNARCVR